MDTLELLDNKELQVLDLGSGVGTSEKEIDANTEETGTRMNRVESYCGAYIFYLVQEG